MAVLTPAKRAEWGETRTRRRGRETEFAWYGGASQTCLVTIPTRSSARTWLAMIPMLLGVLGGALAMSATTMAVPAMTTELGMLPSEVVWIVDAYPLGLAVALVVGARAGDQFGRRWMMMVGLAGFVVFNLVGGFAQSAIVLIIARALLGVSEALVIANVVSTIGAVFLPGERVIAYGLWTATFGAGSAIGPIAGGALAQSAGWQWTQWGGVPIAFIALVLAFFLVPNSRTTHPPHWDLPSIVTSITALGGIVFGLQHSISDPVGAAIAATVGLATGVYFVRRQLRLADPLIDVRLFVIRDFRIAYLQILIGTGGNAATIYLLSLHLQSSRGDDAISAGLAVLPQALTIVIGGVLAPSVLRWISARSLTVLALVTQAAGHAWLAFDPEVLIGPLSLIGLGFGVIGTLTAATLFDVTTPDQAGQVGAVQEVGFALGSGMGVAVLGTVAIAAGPLGFTVALAVAAAAVLIAALVGMRPSKPQPDVTPSLPHPVHEA